MSTEGDEQADADESVIPVNGTEESATTSTLICDASSATFDSQSPTTSNVIGAGDQLSKRQRKRMERRELKRKLYAEERQQRRAQEKERKKQRRADLRAEGVTLPPNRKQLKECTMAKSACRQRIAIDMAYDELMSYKDRCQCVHQLAFCYAANRRLPDPTQLYLLDFTGYTREIFDSVPHRANWDVHVHKDALNVVFPDSEIVYLTSDSDNVITELDDTKVYVIGGLVDHNSHKGVCHDRAVKHQWSHGRLPIDQFVKLKTRQVLTINHVFEILIKFIQQQDWEQAFHAVIPKRKGVQAKDEEKSATCETDCKIVNQNSCAPKSSTQVESSVTAEAN